MNDNNALIAVSENKPTKEPAAARWRRLIEQQEESGLGISAYCRERGFSAASMFAWKRRLRSGGERSVAHPTLPIHRRGRLISATASRAIAGCAFSASTNLRRAWAQHPARMVIAHD
jgi:transposase